jgi:hypothetical protein
LQNLILAQSWKCIIYFDYRTQLPVFENWVLRRIFGTKRKEVAGIWKRLHNERHKFYALPNIIRVIEWWRIWRAGMWHAQAGEECLWNIGWKNWREKKLENLYVEWRILEWILEKQSIADWIHMAQDKENWRAIVNIRVPKKQGNIWLVEQVLYCKERNCSMKLLKYRFFRSVSLKPQFCF